MGRADQGSERAWLRLVREDADRPEPELSDRVRTVRRDMARLLRALQARGLSVATWPQEVVTRLAHVDVVTARYLIAGEGDSETIASATDAMAALARWVIARLDSRDLAEVRAFELIIRVADDELDHPLLCPSGSPEEQNPTVAVVSTGLPPRSLRAGLRGLDDDELAAVCRRLGLRPLELEGPSRTIGRERLEADVRRTLRDDHLLAILVATLSNEVHELLAALVRQELSEAQLRRMIGTRSIALTVSGDVVGGTSRIDDLRGCGLVFQSAPHERPPLWVPVELQHRLDGVLRAFGV